MVRSPGRTVTLFLVVTVGACRDAGPADETGPIELTAADLTVLDADTLLHDVRDIALGSDVLWVLTNYEPVLHAYDLQGEHLWASGTRGQGPGEVGTPWSLVQPAPGDAADMYLWDAGDHHLEGFDRAGRFVGYRTIDLTYGPVYLYYDEGYYGEPLRVHRLGSSVVIANSSGQTSNPRGLWQARLTILDGTGGPRELFSFARHAPDVIDALPEVFTPAPLWAACGTESVLVLDPLAGSLHTIGASGSMDSVVVDLPRPAVDETDTRAWGAYWLAAQARRSGMDPETPESQALLARFLTEATVPDEAAPVGLACDAESRAWVEDFSTEVDPRGYGRTWRQVGSERTITFPAGFRPRVFGRDRIYGVLTDELGVERVAWVAGVPQ